MSNSCWHALMIAISIYVNKKLKNRVEKRWLTEYVTCNLPLLAHFQRRIQKSLWKL